MESLNDILKKFARVELQGINSNRLMNRVDVKFAFPVSKLGSFLKQLSADYELLLVEGNFNLAYQTQYYDTPEFTMYMEHHNNALNRYKVRHRKYLHNNTGFLEVKFKNNKGRTLKERIIQNQMQHAWTNLENKFIAERTIYNPQTLVPKVLVNYTRLTLLNPALNEKVTIDLDLEFLSEINNYKLNNLVIIEVKQATLTKTPVFSVLKDLNIKPLSISKYCLGVNYLYPLLKKNNFKQKLITLSKIINDTPIAHIAGTR
ncbi:MAG: polyphosphate polymerase domain-containing protein [Bacteroidetes bacterium]|nr:polyphosphate polymerase domain-containing protein [Bacteroidota bacterium]